MTPARAAFLIPLLRAQPYIVDARFEETPQGVTHDFSTIRFTTKKDDGSHSLSQWHANHVGIDIYDVDTSPWLKASPDPQYLNRVAIARSLRYINKDFPWTKIFEKHKRNLIFIGFAEECHKLLTRARGKLPMAQVRDAMHMAQIIQGCSQCYMNQSFPLWLALGLGKTVSVECWGPSPDVRIPRTNARYILGGQKENPQFFREL